MALSGPSGFAVRRNGSCLLSETDCGATVDPFRVCCPGTAFCPKQYNQNCCPTAANCTQTLMQKPTCANSTWTMYDNNGYFCCAPGTIGYNATDTYSDGCALPGSPPVGAQLLSIVSAGITSTSSSASSTGAASSTTLAEHSSHRTSKSKHSSSNGGAVAGGVVGGIAALAIILILAFWIFRRRKNKAGSGGDNPGDRHENVGVYYEKDNSVPRVPDPTEADGAALFEMPSSKQELSSTKRSSQIPELQ